MKQFVDALRKGGFKADVPDDHDFERGWFGIIGDKGKITFTSGNKTVVLERKPQPGMGKNITLKRDGKEVLFTPTGDIPPEDLLTEFINLK
jgi:hypothetical protein